MRKPNLKSFERFLILSQQKQRWRNAKPRRKVIPPISPRYRTGRVVE